MTVASIVAGKVAALRASGNEEVRTVKPDVTVAEAIRRMRDELVGALVVSEDGTSILGIISDRGIVDALADHGVDVLKDRVRSVMTEGVLTCSDDDRVGAIMAAMVARRIRHIPVVDEEGRLRGLVSMVRAGGHPLTRSFRSQRAPIRRELAQTRCASIRRVRQCPEWVCSAPTRWLPHDGRDSPAQGGVMTK